MTCRGLGRRISADMGGFISRSVGGLHHRWTREWLIAGVAVFVSMLVNGGIWVTMITIVVVIVALSMCFAICAPLLRRRSGGTGSSA